MTLQHRSEPSDKQVLHAEFSHIVVLGHHHPKGHHLGFGQKGLLEKLQDCTVEVSYITKEMTLPVIFIDHALQTTQLPNSFGQKIFHSRIRVVEAPKLTHLPPFLPWIDIKCKSSKTFMEESRG